MDVENGGIKAYEHMLLCNSRPIDSCCVETVMFYTV